MTSLFLPSQDSRGPAALPWLSLGKTTLLNILAALDRPTPVEVQADLRPLPGTGGDGDAVAQAAADLPAEEEADAGGAPLQAAVLPGVAPLKDPGQVLRRDANAGILHAHVRATLVIDAAIQVDRTVLAVVADGVVCQVVNHFVKQTRKTKNNRRTRILHQGNTVRIRNRFQALTDRVHGARQVNGLGGAQNALRDVRIAVLGLVETRKGQDIVDECRKTRSLATKPFSISSA